MIDARPVVLTVSQLNRYVKSVLDEDANLNCIFMVGEISNFTNHYRTGHLYFTLKDEISAVKAVMFRGNASRLRFMPDNGMSVIIRGRVSVFEATGQYQVYVDDMQPDGVGALSLAYEQLKEKLAGEGLFDASHKKSIPQYPQKIGVITSPTGAALRDILNILKRRFKPAEVVFYPAQVQGENAVPQLVEGIREMNRQAYADVIIIGRGGGSIEDLWAFNSEELARAVYESDIPVISAVGHETDFTICDFVADLRAPTPSAAAELAVPDADEQRVYINSLFNKLYSLVSSEISINRDKLIFLCSKECLKDPLRSLDIKRMYLDKLSNELTSFESRNIETNKLKLLSLTEKLSAVNPANVLLRGYSAVYKDGKIINSKDKIKSGDDIKVTFSDGSAVCTVKEIK